MAGNEYTDKLSGLLTQPGLLDAPSLPAFPWTPTQDATPPQGQMAQNATPGIPTVPIPNDFWPALNAARAKNFDGLSAEEHPLLQKYEGFVDDFIAKQKLQPGDRFQVIHPDGPRMYEMLSPKNAGRKNWYELPPPPSPLVS